MTTAVAVRERPILFSAEMVRAILDGRKTQTRRVVKPQPSKHHGIQPMFGTSPDGFAFGDRTLWREVGPDYPDDESDDRRCPYGSPGDVLWVREAWRSWRWNDHVKPAYFVRHWGDQPARKYVGYCADDDITRDGLTMDGRVRQSIHMPRWASRITLELTNVRVERVQDISEDDAIAEGCFDEKEHDGSLPSHIFRQLWDSLNAKRAPWASNPWVWCLTFARVTP